MRLLRLTLFLLLCLAPFAAASVTSNASAPDKAPSQAHYAYVLGCGATLTKLDLSTQQQVAQVSLARKTNLIQLTGDTGGSTFDGCATYGLAYTPRNQTLYTLSPETGSYRTGGRHFRLLAFHLPDLAFLHSISLTGTVSEQDEIWLRPELDQHGSLLVRLGPKQALHLVAGKLAPAPADPDIPGLTSDTFNGDHFLDTGGYRLVGLPVKSDVNRLSCEEQQQSGDTILIRYIGSAGQSWAAVHPQTRTIVSLNPGFKTTADSFHVAPGGSNILVQETASITPTGLPVMGPRIVLLDAATGTILNQWNNPSPTNPKALALSPSGVAILYARQHFFFLPTATYFPAEPVRNLQPKTPATAEHIFANR